MEREASLALRVSLRVRTRAINCFFVFCFCLKKSKYKDNFFLFSGCYSTCFKALLIPGVEREAFTSSNNPLKQNLHSRTTEIEKRRERKGKRRKRRRKKEMRIKQNK